MRMHLRKRTLTPIGKFGHGALIAGMLAIAAPGGVDAVAPLGTAFSFQGQLKDGGAPADGEYDLVFRLYDAASGGLQVGSSVVINDWAVFNGLFSVQLDFGASPFDGNARWLGVEVRPGNTTGAYTALSPRQPLTAAPFAMYAMNGPGLAGFWAANGNNIYKSNSGNVGIGATDPQANLEVRSSGTPRLRVAKIHSGGFGVTAPAVFELKSNFSGSDGPYGKLNFLDGNDTVQGTIEYGNGPGLLQPVSLRLGTAGQTRMTITDAGLVGIGTVAPAYALDVVGRSRIQQVSGGASAGLWFYQAGPAEDRGFVGMRNDSQLGFWGSEGIGWGMVMDVANGNVGLGTTSPGSKLHVTSGTDTAPGGGGYIVTGETNGPNISMDNNEIMARNNGTTAPLYLNANGGDVRMGEHGILPAYAYGRIRADGVAIAKSANVIAIHAGEGSSLEIEIAGGVASSDISVATEGGEGDACVMRAQPWNGRLRVSAWCTVDGWSRTDFSFVVYRP